MFDPLSPKTRIEGSPHLIPKKILKNSKTIIVSDE